VFIFDNAPNKKDFAQTGSGLALTLCKNGVGNILMKVLKGSVAYGSRFGTI